jgi:hypothetical protein
VASASVALQNESAQAIFFHDRSKNCVRLFARVIGRNCAMTRWAFYFSPPADLGKVNCVGLHFLRGYFSSVFRNQSIKISSKCFAEQCSISGKLSIVSRKCSWISLEVL